MSVDNKLLARILHANKLATQEQLQSHWSLVKADIDIGQVLVNAGLLDPSIYVQLLDYAEKLSAQQNAQAEKATPQAPAVNPAPAPTAPPEPSSASEVETPTSIIEKSPEPQVITPAQDTVSSLIETTPVFESKPVDVAPIEQLEGNQLGSFQGAIAQDNKTTPTQTQPTPAIVHEIEAEVYLPQIRSGERGQGSLRVQPKNVDECQSLEELLLCVRQEEASDLHLSPGFPIHFRKYRQLIRVGTRVWTAEAIESIISAALPPASLELFKQTGDLELVLSYPGLGRFRMTLMRQRQGWDLCARAIAKDLPSFEALKLPEVCKQLTQWAQGLVLVTGPAGCGKTTTLSVLVDLVNQSRHDHIITVEDPIEIVYPKGNCQVTQRQVMEHTLSRANALRAALRQDPDILVVSELRDLESMQLAISAAETGHLVFGTMNTVSARRTLSRLIDSFPPEEQDVIRNMVSESLRGIISQQLIPRKDGQGTVAAFEVLKVTPAVSNQIRKNDLVSIDSTMTTGKADGMVQLDDSLRSLVEQGLIDGKEAYYRAVNPNNFAQYINR